MVSAIADRPPRQNGKAGLDSIEITPEFRSALDMMEKPGQSVFITGRAGTGKSTLLRYFKETSSRPPVTLAPTGIAALHVGGQTLHSFFGFPHHFLDRAQVKKAKRYKKVIEKLDTLVIDEMSMVRADIFDAVDQCLRITRQSALPFGGVKLILFGDVFQLPPVVEPDLAALFTDRYPGPFFFDAPAWRDLNPTCLELNKVFRQEGDTDFLDILNRVRERSATAEDLAVLNQRCGPDGDPTGPHIVLAATNAVARDLNSARLDALAGKPHSYTARVEGDFEQSSFPTDAVLSLKKGAQILMVRNDSEKRWVNGDLGEAVEFGDEFVRVKIKGVAHEVKPVVWEKYVYRLNEKTGSVEPVVVGTFEQMPLKLAWAITIHKSQGQTYDRVTVDLGHGAFAHGQTYVALSRCTTLKGLRLRRPLRERDILCHDRVQDFYRQRFDRKNDQFVDNWRDCNNNSSTDMGRANK